MFTMPDGYRYTKKDERMSSSFRKRLRRLQGLRLRLLSPLQSKSGGPSPHSLLLTTISIRLWPDVISVQWSGVFACTLFVLRWSGLSWGGPFYSGGGGGYRVLGVLGVLSIQGTRLLHWVLGVLHVLPGVVLGCWGC